MNLVCTNWSIPTSIDNLEQRRCVPGYFFTTYPETRNDRCFSELLFHSWSLRAGWEILKPINQPQPTIWPPWHVTCYCQMTLHVQHCTALGFEQKPPATKRSFELLTVPQQSGFQKRRCPLSCTQQHSNWDTTAFGYPHTAVQQTRKKMTIWYKLWENKWSSWQLCLASN